MIKIDEDKLIEILKDKLKVDIFAGVECCALCGYEGLAGAGVDDKVEEIFTEIKQTGENV
ncbi:MAG: hypothetical protein ACW99A_22580 [Candidatus Kariarchaeaceae archaeon]|jgi:hypothetical protein